MVHRWTNRFFVFGMVALCKNDRATGLHVAIQVIHVVNAPHKRTVNHLPDADIFYAHYPRGECTVNEHNTDIYF